MEGRKQIKLGADTAKNKTSIVIHEEVMEEQFASSALPANGTNPKKAEQEEKKEQHYNSYKVCLDVDPQARMIQGIQKVYYKNQADRQIQEIYFHTYLNAFRSDATMKPYFPDSQSRVYRRGTEEGWMEIQSASINNYEVTVTQKETMLRIESKEPIAPGENIEIMLQFTSHIPALAHRTGANDQAMWLGNYLPILAVYDEEGWHRDPYYPAGDPFFSEISNYEVEVTTPKEYTVIGTGVESEEIDQQKKVTKIKAKMVRDFALAIGKEFHKERIETDSGVTINFYHYTDKLFYLDKIMNIAKKSIEYYSERVGTYPYQELDIVEAELFLEGGMEYPQFILIDSLRLRKSEVESTIAHEIGHQWFYNIIGNNQVKEPWLDEGLTMYVQQGIFYSPEQIHTMMGKELRDLRKQLEPMREKSLLQDLGAYSTWNSYYRIHYTRSKLMMHALYLKMGAERFDLFLKTYYKKYAFQVVRKQDFIDTAEEVYGRSLYFFFEEWLMKDELPDF